MTVAKSIVHERCVTDNLLSKSGVFDLKYLELWRADGRRRAHRR